MNKLAMLLLRLLDAERAHGIASREMAKRRFAPGPYISKTPVKLFGDEINNPLGLAAGFDKNGDLVDVIEDYGFGWVEVGSVTYLGGDGNPKPRLFRVGRRDIMNRMGLNGQPAWLVAEKLKMARRTVYAINITKTHDPSIMGDKAIRDVAETYRLLRGYGMYLVLNISCPNTAEGKTFEEPEPLAELLAACDALRVSQPLLVKLSPNLYLHNERLDKLLRVCADYKIDGYVCSNTVTHNHPKHGKGGRSGDAVRKQSIGLTGQVSSWTGLPVIGCGGIFTAKHMLDYRGSGAFAFQAYNGFVRGPNAGVRFAHRLNRDFEAYKS